MHTWSSEKLYNRPLALSWERDSQLRMRPACDPDQRSSRFPNCIWGGDPWDREGRQREGRRKGKGEKRKEGKGKGMSGGEIEKIPYGHFFFPNSSPEYSTYCAKPLKHACIRHRWSAFFLLPVTVTHHVTFIIVRLCGVCMDSYKLTGSHDDNETRITLCVQELCRLQFSKPAVCRFNRNVLNLVQQTILPSMYCIHSLYHMWYNTVLVILHFSWLQSQMLNIYTCAKQWTWCRWTCISCWYSSVSKIPPKLAVVIFCRMNTFLDAKPTVSNQSKQ